jgi:hypothetical protein
MDERLLFILKTDLTSRAMDALMCNWMPTGKVQHKSPSRAKNNPILK